MSVNTEIWGPLVEPTGAWQTVMGENVKLSKSVSDTLSTGNNIHEPLDNSVCLFGFGLNSPFQNMEFASWDFTNQTMVTVKPFRQTIIPWGMCVTTNRYTSAVDELLSPVPPNEYIWGNNYRWLTAWPYDDPDMDRYLGGEIMVNRYVVDFDYQKKYLVLIQGVCTHTHQSGGTTYTNGQLTSWITVPNWLDNYKTNFDSICRIILVPAIYGDINSMGCFSLFTEITKDINIDYPESDTEHHNMQLIPKDWYAYRLQGQAALTYDGGGNYFDWGFTIAGGYSSNPVDVRGRWTAFFKPTVGDWDINDVFENGRWTARYAAYHPGAKTNDEIIDDLAHICAHMGVFFTFDRTKINADNDDRDVFLGILSGGISTGEYTRGTDNRLSDQFDWGSPTESGFNPADLGDKLIVDTQGSQMRQPLYAMIGGYSYVMSGSKFVDIWKKMNDDFTARYQDLKDTLDLWKTTYDNDQDDPLLETISKRISWAVTSLKDMFTGSVKGIGQDPNTAIKSILCFPFDLTPYIATEDHYFKWGFNVIQDPNIGTVKQVTGLKSQFWLNGGTVQTTLSTGTYVANARSFLDYAPYTTSQLYLPYCGCVDIDPAIYVNKTLTVRYLVDYITGACTAFIYAGNDIIDQIAGNMAISISLSNLDTASYMNSVIQGNQAFKIAKSSIANALGGAISLASKTGLNNIGTDLTIASSISDSIVGLENANYQLATAPVNFKQIMYASPFIATGADQRVRLYVYRPITLGGSVVDAGTTWGDYGHTTGFACIINNTITGSGISGYLQGNIDTDGIAATETEKEMIRSLVSNGVYV